MVDRENEQIQSLAEFRYLLRRFLQFSERAATEVGLTPQQHQLLLQITGAPTGTYTTVSYLADRLALRHHSVVELTLRCEEADLVVRHRNEKNRREVVLELSAKGTTLMETLASAHARELNEFGPQLTHLLQRLTNSTPHFGTEPRSEDQQGRTGA